MEKEYIENLRIVAKVGGNKISQQNLHILREKYHLADAEMVEMCIFRKNCASVPEERSAIPLQTEQSSAG